MQLTRRTLLNGIAPGAVAIAIAGCTTNATTGVISLDPAVIDFIQNAVAAAAKYIPAAESIAQTAAALFGPAYSAIVTAGSAAANQIIAFLENAVTNLTPAASARLRARFGATTGNVLITTAVANGVTVNIIGRRL